MFETSTLLLRSCYKRLSQYRWPALAAPGVTASTRLTRTGSLPSVSKALARGPWRWPLMGSESAACRPQAWPGRAGAARLRSQARSVVSTLRLGVGGMSSTELELVYLWRAISVGVDVRADGSHLRRHSPSRGGLPPGDSESGLLATRSQTSESALAVPIDPNGGPQGGMPACSFSQARLIDSDYDVGVRAAAVTVSRWRSPDAQPAGGRESESESRTEAARPV